MIKKLKGPLWLQVLIAMALGLTTGLLLAPSGAGILSEHAVGHVIPWIALPGNLFLALIKMVVIPLVFSSIVLGLTSSPDPEFLRKAALRIFPYFVATTAIAVAIGISLALLFKPGRYIDSEMVSRLWRDSHHSVKSSTTDTNSSSQGLSALRAVNARELAEAAARQQLLAGEPLRIVRCQKDRDWS